MATTSEEKLLAGLNENELANKTVIVTGAGRGIGFEAARWLLRLGANVILADVDETKGRAALKALADKFGESRVMLVVGDVGSEADVSRLAVESTNRFHKVDAVLNATISPIGSVTELPIEEWDRSYRVNLRGPVLLARAFLPGMIARGSGAFICISSSGAAPYMAAYEAFKTAQVELASTLSGELSGTGVKAFTIGPGIVRTPGFEESGSKVAQHMGITTEELVKMNENWLLSVAEAGLGFAASIVLADKYNGSEISAIQVLRDLESMAIRGSDSCSPGQSRENSGSHDPVPCDACVETRPGSPVVQGKSGIEPALPTRVGSTFAQQVDGWKTRNVFERQWIFRDFKKHVGCSVDEMVALLSPLSNSPINKLESFVEPMRKLRSYYAHQLTLVKGFEKDAGKLEMALATLSSWMDEIDAAIQQIANTEAI